MSKNEKIKKIINFKYIKKGKDTLQKKAVKALFAFLVLMIGCTMLSRAADSMTIPRIKVDTPKSKTIVDEVKAKGVVAKNREEKISVVEGLKINYVNISVGSSIKLNLIRMIYKLKLMKLKRILNKNKRLYHVQRKITTRL